MAGLVQVPFGHAMVSHIEPVGPPQAYKTYSLAFPVQTHWRPATCAEVDCEAYLNGWATTVDTATDLGQRQHGYCSRDKTRTFTTDRPGPTPSLVRFTYIAGQKCFGAADHKVRLERVPRFLVTPGDFRQRTGSPLVHKRPADWVEDFAGHQDKISTALQRG